MPNVRGILHVIKFVWPFKSHHYLNCTVYVCTVSPDFPGDSTDAVARYVSFVQITFTCKDSPGLIRLICLSSSSSLSWGAMEVTFCLVLVQPSLESITYRHTGSVMHSLLYALRNSTAVIRYNNTIYFWSGSIPASGANHAVNKCSAGQVEEQ